MQIMFIESARAAPSLAIPHCNARNVRAATWNLQPANFMTPANQAQIERVKRKIADLNKSDAREAKNGVGLLGKLNRA